MNKIVLRIIVLLSVFLFVACSLVNLTGATPSAPAAERATLIPYEILQTAVVQATPVVIGVPTGGAASDQPAQVLQPCSLVTTAEVEAILGEPASAPQVSPAGCAFSSAKDAFYAVSLGVARAEEAEGLLQGHVMLLGFAGAPFDQAKMTILNQLSDAQDFKAFFNELITTAQKSPIIKAKLVQDGVNTPVANDLQYWAWLTPQGRRQGAYIAQRGKTLVNINVVVAESNSEQSMLEACQSLANKIFERLPANFTIAEPTSAPTQPLPTTIPMLPSATLVPTLPPTLIPTQPLPTLIPTQPWPTQVPNGPPTSVWPTSVGPTPVGPTPVGPTPVK